MNPIFILVPSVAPTPLPADETQHNYCTCSREGVIILLKLHFSSSAIDGGQWLWGRVVRKF